MDIRDDLAYAIGYVQALPTKRKYRALKPWADQLALHLERILACVEGEYLPERRITNGNDAGGDVEIPSRDVLEEGHVQGGGRDST